MTTAKVGNAGENDERSLANEAELLWRSTADRTINPDLQRFMADRPGAHVISLGASHLSLISHPTEVAGLIQLATRGA